MLVTLVILALLASLAVPTIEITIKRQKESQLRTALIEIRTAIDAYKKAVDEGKVAKKADESGYPPNLNVLYEGVQVAGTPEKKKIFFIRRLPRDPFYPDTAAPPESTWGKRSYESDYDAPHEGKDVYDIYSLSPDTAIDGTAYRAW